MKAKKGKKKKKKKQKKKYGTEEKRGKKGHFSHTHTALDDNTENKKNNKIQEKNEKKKINPAEWEQANAQQATGGPNRGMGFNLGRFAVAVCVLLLHHHLRPHLPSTCCTGGGIQEYSDGSDMALTHSN